MSEAKVIHGLQIPCKYIQGQSRAWEHLNSEGKKMADLTWTATDIPPAEPSKPNICTPNASLCELNYTQSKMENIYLPHLTLLCLAAT